MKILNLPFNSSSTPSSYTRGFLLSPSPVIFLPIFGFVCLYSRIKYFRVCLSSSDSELYFLKFNSFALQVLFNLKFPLWLMPLMMLIHSLLLGEAPSLITVWGICLMTLLLPVGLHISYCSWQILDFPQGKF